MNSVNISDTNWKAVKFTADIDDSVKTLNDRDYSPLDGFDLKFNNFNTKLEDTKINNFSNILLTDSIEFKDVLKIDTNIDEYPTRFITYFAHSSYDSITSDSKFWYIEESRLEDFTRSFSISGSNSNLTNNCYFEVRLLNKHQLTIQHDDNFSLTYLTYNPVSEVCEFKKNRANTSLSGTQIFDYILDSVNGFITLSVGNKYLRRDINDNSLKVFDVEPGEIGYPLDSIIRILPFSRTSTTLDVKNYWNSYKNIQNENSLKVSEDNSFENIKNNYILHTQYYNITGHEAPVNMFPLKNQLTPGYNQSRQNPYKNLNDVTFRSYNKVFGGTNQITGHSDLYLSYSDFTTEYEFKPDKITYFHAPRNMFPWKSININDTGLIHSGAIGGDSPLKSDKVFQKAAGYDDSTPWGNTRTEQHGQWLCAWLKSDISVEWNDETAYYKNIIVDRKGISYKCLQDNFNRDPEKFGNEEIWEVTNSKTMWVDRYYNPSRYTTNEAMAISGYFNYKDSVESITERLEAEQDIVFDVQSGVRFEPGSLYAYYRVGSNESRGAINKQAGDLVLKDLDIFNDITGTSIIASDAGDTKLYEFTGERYGKFNTIDEVKRSDFSISFWLYSDDWSRPMGEQIIGNYINQGIGIYNKHSTTPLLGFKDSNKITFTNNKLETVSVLSASSDHFINDVSFEDNYTLSGTDMYQYDMNNILKEKTALQDIVNVVDCNDATIEGDNIYLLINGAVSGISKITEEVIDTSDMDVREIGSGTYNKLHITQSGVVIKSSISELDYDSKGHIWYADSGNIYRYKIEDRSTITALSTTNTIKDIKIDEDDNIWCLISTSSASKLVKYTNNREKILSVELNSNLASDLSGTDTSNCEKILLLSDFSRGKYNTYCSVLKRDNNGATSLINVNYDGTYASSSLSALNLENNLNTYKHIINRRHPDKDNTLHFDLKLVNPYNLDDSITNTIDYNVHELAPEWHHFCYSFNGNNGSITLYVDGQLERTSTITSLQQSLKYKFVNTLKDPISVGATAFFNNKLAADFLKIPTNGLSNNIQIKGLRLYDKELELFTVKALAREYSTIESVNLILPGGKRNYIDHITKFYKHRLPGNKSNAFDISIVSNTLTEDKLKVSLEDHVKKSISNYIPLNANLNKIHWIK